MLKNIKQYLVVVVISFLAPFVTAAQLVNINTADAVTIAENLNGIGASKAKAIIEYRELHGDFRNADDLVKVKGIGFKLVERNSALISFKNEVNSAASATPAATPVKTPVTTSDNASAGVVAPAN